MNQSDFEIWKNFFLQPDLFVNCCFDLIVFSGFYQRIDNKCLMTQFHLFSNSLIDPFALGWVDDHRRYRQPACWHFVHYAHVQVPKNGELKGTWNWCGSHYQKMWIVTFISQSRSLRNAKTMLLIDHDHLQILECDWVLNQRVGANQKLYITRFQPTENFSTICLTGISGQQAHLPFFQESRVLFCADCEQIANGLIVLFSQDTSWRHQGCLCA